MSEDYNRLLVQLDKLRKEINREVINPVIEPLVLSEFEPMIRMVARARAAYVKELLDLAKVTPTGLPSLDQLKKLRHYRAAFEELVEAANALESMIKRGYLDVEAKRK